MPLLQENDRDSGGPCRPDQLDRPRDTPLIAGHVWSAAIRVVAGLLVVDGDQDGLTYQDVWHAHALPSVLAGSSGTAQAVSGFQPSSTTSSTNGRGASGPLEIQIISPEAPQSTVVTT